MLRGNAWNFRVTLSESSVIIVASTRGVMNVFLISVGAGKESPQQKRENVGFCLNLLDVPVKNEPK